MFRYHLIIVSVIVVSGCFKKDTSKAVDTEVLDSPSVIVPTASSDVPKRSLTPTLEPDKLEQGSDKDTSKRVQNPALREEARLEAMKELKKARGQEAAHK